MLITHQRYKIAFEGFQSRNRKEPEKQKYNVDTIYIYIYIVHVSVHVYCLFLSWQGSWHSVVICTSQHSLNCLLG